MSKKNSRAWFICPQWENLVARHYPSDAEAAFTLRTDPKVLAKLRSGTPVAKSTLLKMLRQSAGKHPLSVPADELVVDVRTR
jgi:hypothetical protein